MTPQECVFKAISHRTTATLESFISETRDWEFIPIEREGEVCGSVMRRNSEVHIALLPKVQNHTWIRGVIRKELSKVIADHGHAFTWIVDGHTVGHRLARIIGFKQITCGVGPNRYECTEMAI